MAEQTNAYVLYTFRVQAMLLSTDGDGFENEAGSAQCKHVCCSIHNDKNWTLHKLIESLKDQMTKVFGTVCML